MIGQVERILELKKLQYRDKEIFSKNIFSFTSGKGGTGKTFLSLNTAFALSETGKKVLFIDHDLNFSNANILLNISPSKTLADFYSGRNSFDDILHSVSKNLDLIFGDSGSLDESLNIKFSDLLNELKKNRNNYDFIFIDTSAGLSAETMEVLLNSSFNVIVASPEPTAVMDAYVIIKSLRKNHYKGVISAIINKCSRIDEGLTAFGNLSSAVSHFLKDKIQLLSLITFDQNVQKSVIDQELFLKNFPSSELVSQIIELSVKLSEIKQVANIPHLKK